MLLWSMTNICAAFKQKKAEEEEEEEEGEDFEGEDCSNWYLHYTHVLFSTLSLQRHHLLWPSAAAVLGLKQNYPGS